MTSILVGFGIGLMLCWFIGGLGVCVLIALFPQDVRDADGRVVVGVERTLVDLVVVVWWPLWAIPAVLKDDE